MGRLRRAFFAVFAFGVVPLVLVVIAFAVAAWIPQQPLVMQRPIVQAAFSNVAVVDVRAGVVRPGMRVEIVDGRIVSVEPEAQQPAAGGAKVIDGSGKFLIPGLWDMHVHHWFDMSTYLHSPLYVANGVTSVRDMGSCANEDAPFMSCASAKRAWSSAAAAGEMIGPRIVANGSFPIEVAGHANRKLDGYITPSSPDAARELVANVPRRQWDFIKVYNHLPRDVYFALLDEASRHGVEVSGHLPFGIELEEAVRAGQRSIEHATVLPIACSDAEEALRTSAEPLSPMAVMREALARPNPERCRTSLAAMVERGSWYTPTHVTRRFEAYASDPAFLDDSRMSYISFAWRVVWHLDVKRMQRRSTEADDPELLRKFYERGLALTDEAHRAGVRILAGTDAPDTYAFPGFGLHDELSELVRAGLTPADALRAATLAPATYTGEVEHRGSIEPGKVADLVLLGADPLSDIDNTRRIEMVIAGGRIYDRQDLDDMLSFVERKASSVAVFCKALWRLLCSQEFRNMFDD